ncbi:MAG: site-specific DNA-methyltransferase, partial [Clostridiales bacterium]|nr:site-specific DNA-methyltransferase [Clostridiales bacterium]
MKLTREDLDKVRHIEGFPIGEDEDIIALSDPPYYTACPNPFIEDFIEEHGTPYDEETDDYKREPFAADVSEGKNDPIYNAHSYHTKVPHKAIMRYILHYTEPGDIVFDGFCGTGMTGVAAQMCGNPDADLEFKYKIEKEMPGVKWGTRKAILNDLSPAATFIAYNYNTPVDVVEFEKEANRILEECEEELGWMYETNHVDENENQIHDMTGPVKGKINYTVWSDVFICPNCGEELVFWNAAVDKETGKIRSTFYCGNCSIELGKRDCNKSIKLTFDERIGKTIELIKQVPVLANYNVGRERFEKKPDDNDMKLINEIANMEIPYWFPSNEIKHGDKTREMLNRHIKYIHQVYTKRTLHVLSGVFEKINSVSDYEIRQSLKFMFTGAIIRLNKTNKYIPSLKIAPGPIMGTFYMPSLYPEINALNGLHNKYKNLSRFMEITKRNQGNNIITTQSSNNLSNMEDNSVDYIFTDPPFGANLMYSELNMIWE